MRDWNVIVTVAERGFARAFESLEKMGQVGKTDYYNVLMMKVDDIHSLMEKLWELSSEDPNALSYLTRLVPVTHSFTFKSAEEFKEKAKEIALSYARELAGKSFHVRMHRRGFKGRLSSVDEEKFLDDVLLEALDRAGSPGHITFEDPDAIVAVETVGTQAGLSLWSREDLRLYPFLRLD